MTFAEKIQKLRKERGLSQDQLAAALGVSRQSISKWELGSDMPKVDKILLLSDFFGVSTDYLLHDDWEAPHRRHYSNEQTDTESGHASAEDAAHTKPAENPKAKASSPEKELKIICLLSLCLLFIAFILLEINSGASFMTGVKLILALFISLALRVGLPILGIYWIIKTITRH